MRKDVACSPLLAPSHSFLCFSVSVSSIPPHLQSYPSSSIYTIVDYSRLAPSHNPQPMRSRTNSRHRASAGPNPRPQRASAIHWLFSSNLPHRRSSAALSADIGRRNFFGMSEIFGVLLNAGIFYPVSRLWAYYFALASYSRRRPSAP